ncbi:uncharacterized protein LOC127251299 isoform X3 [Andrographis paniculata]|uniref:uncharacterized protein LOC127251299 isoform X3 n=1 Tax=Andrographis paniculata TaxID=175694 RepID=UPI0021E72334|nr:uncharacterized protein LOC127251299 isoform X3 [Andrographis paniculata]
MRFRFKAPVPLALLRRPLPAGIHSVSSSSFGIAFDIDGVILRGAAPIGNSERALRRLYDDSGSLKVPFLFLTNGGGIPESRRASDLSNLLGVNILPSQVVHGHSPFKTLLNRFENEFIVATGKGEPAVVMSEYGFKRVVSIDEYVSHFKNIDPVAQYKRWTTVQDSNFSRNSKTVSSCGDFSQSVKAAFVVSDPVDWGRDIQVLCDILTSGGVPGKKLGDQPPLFFAADDLQYQLTTNCRLHFLRSVLAWAHSELPLRVSSIEFMTSHWSTPHSGSRIHLFLKMLKLYYSIFYSLSIARIHLSTGLLSEPFI